MKFDNPLPVEKCCEAIQRGWDNSVFGIDLVSDSHEVGLNGKKDWAEMVWFEYENGRKVRYSQTCLFCNKLLTIKEK